MGGNPTGTKPKLKPKRKILIPTPRKPWEGKPRKSPKGIGPGS